MNKKVSLNKYIFVGMPSDNIKNWINSKVIKFNYNDFDLLLSDIKNNEIGKNSVTEDSLLYISYTSNRKFIYLNNNHIIDKTIDINGLKNIEINLNSKKVLGNTTLFNISNCEDITIKKLNIDITSDSQNNLINVSDSIYTQFNEGKINFVTDGNEDKNNPICIFNISNSNILISNFSELKIQDKTQTKSVATIKADINSNINIMSSILYAISKSSFSYGIYSLGKLNISDSKIIADSDHTANAAGNDYGTTSRGIYSENELYIKNSYVYGTHSGITVKGEKLYVDGGTYESYSHGGIYICKGINQIYNAILKECPLNEGYIDDGRAGTNHAGLYIGGGSNINTYIDNCVIKGEIQPIVVKDGSSEINNNLYISNSKINLDCIEKYTPIIGNYNEMSNIIVGIYGGGIRNYNSKNTIHFGENCGVANIKDIKNDTSNNLLPIRPNYLRVGSKTKTMNDYSFEVTNEKYIT